MRLCCCPTPWRAHSLGRFVACWHSFSLTLSHVGRLQGSRRGSQASLPQACIHCNQRSEKVAVTFLLPPPPSLFTTGDVITAARAAKGGLLPSMGMLSTFCTSSVSFMGMKVSSSTPKEVARNGDQAMTPWSSECQPYQSCFTSQHQGMPP